MRGCHLIPSHRETTGGVIPSPARPERIHRPRWENAWQMGRKQSQGQWRQLWYITYGVPDYFGFPRRIRPRHRPAPL